MTPHEQAQLDEALAMLPPEHAELVSRLVEPPSRQQQRRLGHRDAQIREARAAFFPGDLWAAARAMEQALSAYLTTSWPRERHLAELPSGADPQRRAIHRIAQAGRGAEIGARQLHNIFRGERTPIA